MSITTQCASFAATLLAQSSAAPAPTPTPTTLPAEPAAGLIIWSVALLLAAFIFWRTRAYRPSTILGPPRLDPHEPLGPYMVAEGIALFAWIMIPALYAMSTASLQSPPGGPTSIPATTPATTRAADPSNPLNLTPREMVSIHAVAGAIPVILIFILYRAQRHPGLSRLGLTQANLPRALPAALAGSLFVIPVIFWFSIFLVWLFQLLRVEHPQKHQLLLLLDQTRDLITRLLMVVAAVVVAPIFEELLFRAHFQTILSHLFARRRITYGPSTPPPFDLPYPPPPGVMHPLTYENRPPSRWESHPGAPARWAAVLITSLLFAAVHEWWTAPAIFLLSLCFGYVYERTGNLYVPILMHIAFNGVSIILSTFA